MRKKKTITLKDGGKEKTYIIQRMNAVEGDDWANEMIAGMVRGSPGMFLETANIGMQELASTKEYFVKIFTAPWLSNIDHKTRQWCFGKLLNCIKRSDPATGMEREIDWNDPDSDFESLDTLPRLRKEAFLFHVDFIKREVDQIFHLGKGLMTAMGSVLAQRNLPSLPDQPTSPRK